MAKSRKSLAHYKTVKHTVKYLSHAPDISAVLAVLKGAPNGVIEAISNAALNARQGDVQLTPAQKKLFRAHAESFDILTDRRRSIAEKRQHLLSHKRNASLQEGGAFPIAALVVPLLTSVIGSIGSEFISRFISRPSGE